MYVRAISLFQFVERSITFRIFDEDCVSDDEVDLYLTIFVESAWKYYTVALKSQLNNSFAICYNTCGVKLLDVSALSDILRVGYTLDTIAPV